MSITAAFLWQKSKTSSICTFIYNTEDLTIYSKPQKFTISKSIAFKKQVKSIVKKFATTVKNLSNSGEIINIEYRILLLKKRLDMMKPSPESKFVFNSFSKSLKQLLKKKSNIILQPQLKRKLSGKDLIAFKRELRIMELVSRKKTTAFEYALWSIALHATKKTYAAKLKNLNRTLWNFYWQESI